MLLINLLGLLGVVAHALQPSRTCTPIPQRFLSGRNLCMAQKDIEQVAKAAARAAGKLMLDGIATARSDITNKIGSRDIVTQVDKDVQDEIQRIVLAAFPLHKFLGEEDILPGRKASAEATDRFEASENLWIVDPIDGTTNFAHTMPLSGTIIAYAERGVVLYGLIYDPYRDEMFTAWRGQGAYMNGARITCSSAVTMKESVICTGSPPNFLALDACLRATNLISKDVRTMRMLGSAAIMLAWVACGRMEAYFEADLNAWDLAAGSLLIEEAGGKVTDVWGKRYDLATRNLVSTNGKIHEELRERLLEAEMFIKE